ncbi:peptide/nickel transport system ATP-binding protein/oligopeptide transport system ATP-binding protein [Microbacterium sp. AG790]|uniref:ABC transporter ATP-binding protein n=1 Tax=Microbacterium sp. AG790 TaxID=2183995 RepID=UPI000EAFC4BC|nr:oligopeptide/dipeptide ABC transporter ATP-binding protein [Microbacterium sp. AG790]RKS94372.1 peptide/nickel transport system ATP-binding protein/oligopeptide transport system ATP-binding protein [Microbacterium sp. AG790]
MTALTPGLTDDAATTATTPLLRMRSVSKHYTVRTSSNPLQRPSMLRAVDDVSIDIQPAETFALVGESGSGKSTLGRLALRLIEPTSGSVEFDGEDITAAGASRLRALRRDMQMVFQDPLGSLNPRMKVGQIIGEPLRVFEHLRGAELSDRVAELMTAVGLDPSRASARPRALSGGQRQRVGIARAIALNPKLILADEAVSALDVSVQAQIANLLVELRERLGLTYLFIGHGLPIVRQISQRVGVMYMGRIVESGPIDDVFAAPAHPYTRALMAASPVPDPTVRRERIMLKGEPPSPLSLPSGCRFRTRCPLATAECAEEAPPLIEVAPGHLAECFFAERIAV